MPWPKDFFSFSRAEVRGVLWLLPLLAVVAAILVFANRPRFEKSFLQQVEEASVEDVDLQRRTVDDTLTRRGERVEPELAPFDPNRLGVDGFERLGFSRRQAEAIVRYRTACGGFRTADDFGKSYVVSDEMMARLRPYINIAPVARVVQADTSGVFPGRVVAADTLGTASVRGASVCVEINGADSATLRSVSGIGNVLVVRILDYRERLGGFVDAGQLQEIPGMYPENFRRIEAQISVDSCVIRKIDINFATPEVLGKHPYITSEVLRKILKHRQLKGGWRTIEELVNENIITQQQAARLAPYLVFN